MRCNNKNPTISACAIQLTQTLTGCNNTNPSTVWTKKHQKAISLRCNNTKLTIPDHAKSQLCVMQLTLLQDTKTPIKQCPNNTNQSNRGIINQRLLISHRSNAISNKKRIVHKGDGEARTLPNEEIYIEKEISWLQIFFSLEDYGVCRRLLRVFFVGMKNRIESKKRKRNEFCLLFLVECANSYTLIKKGLLHIGST